MIRRLFAILAMGAAIVLFAVLGAALGKRFAASLFQPTAEPTAVSQVTMMPQVTVIPNGDVPPTATLTPEETSRQIKIVLDVLNDLDWCKVLYNGASVANAIGMREDMHEYYYEVMTGQVPNANPLYARERMQTLADIGIVTCKNPQIVEIFNLFATELTSP